MWALLFLAFAWVVFNAPQDGLWYDETVNAYLATHSWGTLWEWSTSIDNQLPLHFAALKLWVGVAGSTEFSLRAFSQLTALLALAGVIGIARRLGGRTQAWLSGLIFISLGSYVYAASEVRTYALALALLTWSSVFVWDMVQKPSRHLMLAYLVTALLLAYTHYTAWLAIGLQIVFMGAGVIFHQSTKRLQLWHIALVVLVLGLGVMPWLVALSGRNFNEGTAFEGKVSIQSALEDYWNFALWGQKVFDTAATEIGLYIAGLVVIALVLHGRKQQRLYSLYLIGLIVLPLVFMTYSVTQVEAKLAGRHTWAMWPSIAIILGGGIVRLPRWEWLRWATALIIVGVLVSGSRALDEEYTGDFERVQTILEREATVNDLLILRDGTLFTAAEYYAYPLPYVGIPSDKLTNINHRVQVHEAWNLFTDHLTPETRRVWVLSWQGEVMDPMGLAYAIPEYFSTGTRHDWLEGDTQLVSYDITTDRPNLIERIVAYAGVIQVPPDGPSLLGAEVLPMLNGGGCGVIIHTWWWRGTTDYPDTMISARLVNPTGERVAQYDMPPAGFYFDQADWQPFIPTLGRVELNYSCALWQVGQDYAVEMVVYDRMGAKPAQPIDLGTIRR